MDHSKPAHNAKMAGPLIYQGRQFASLADLYRSHGNINEVSFELFCSRVRKALRQDTDGWTDQLSDCLMLPAKDYFAKYARRRTFCEIEGVKVDLQQTYNSINSPAVTYPQFRSRVLSLKNRESLIAESVGAAFSVSMELVKSAAEKDRTAWRRGWGSSRLSPVIFGGVVYPTYMEFISAQGREDDAGMIRARLKNGWEPETALEPKLSRGGGLVYLITQNSTGLEYVGLTTTTKGIRWSRHKRSARQGCPYRLHRAIRETGVKDFSISILEDEIGDEGTLKAREEYHIAARDCIWPRGLNGNKGGVLGGGRSQKCRYGDEEFNSIEERNRVLGERFGIPPYVIARRLREGVSLETPARSVHGQHLGDERHQRQWLKIIRDADRGKIQLYEPWRRKENWLRDIAPCDHEGLHLVHLNPDKPFAPGNVVWMTEQEKVQHIHGKAIACHGREYPSLAALARHYRVCESTLKHRIREQKMSPEEAVSFHKGKTSKKPTTFEGEDFSSLAEAARVLSRRHGIGFDKARDRIRRNVPTFKW